MQKGAKTVNPKNRRKFHSCFRKQTKNMLFFVCLRHVHRVYTNLALFSLVATKKKKTVRCEIKLLDPFTTENPFLRTKLFGFSIGRGSGALKGLRVIPRTGSTFFGPNVS